ncbi:unnamed protein product [Parascedosporium putredinis]|uniref:Uncharacterized protein n=1 Tax=Parascedosporium putredinis TaxID=1442378 RepID=A0A9P1GWK7_9PEZI|nr:unnamed protein product [Parascedosporium putredinis]CAI7988336.1 unnamed protein product [Parascedosporium putredinis]
MKTLGSLTAVLLFSGSAFGAKFRRQNVEPTPTAVESGSRTPTDGLEDITSTATQTRSTPTGSPLAFCQSIFEDYLEGLPAVPTEALSFSEEYYSSHTRTATETLSDCAWVTAIPESIDVPMVDYFEKLLDFFNDPGKQVQQVTLSGCKNLDWNSTDDAVSICEEFDTYAEELEKRADEKGLRSEPADDDDDDSAGAATRPTLLVTGLLAYGALAIGWGLLN